MIAAYRREGLGCTEISRRIALSINTVKSYCKRKGLSGIGLNGHGMTGNRPNADDRLTGNRNANAYAVALQETGRVYLQCRAPLGSTSPSQSKRFCSDRCRFAWWHAHRGEGKGAVDRGVSAVRRSFPYRPGTEILLSCLLYRSQIRRCAIMTDMLKNTSVPERCGEQYVPPRCIIPFLGAI